MKAAILGHLCLGSLAKPDAAILQRYARWVSVQPGVKRPVDQTSRIRSGAPPEINGQFQYRIKSVNEPHERVVRESQLRKSQFKTPQV